LRKPESVSSCFFLLVQDDGQPVRDSLY